MKRFVIAMLFVFCFLLANLFSLAQCSICTRTAEQMGEKSALGLNTGIIYLALIPILLVGLIGYRWWRRNA
jgi:hypothetical protein